MVASFVTTMVMGALVISAGLWFASLEKMPIFKMMVNFGGWVALPISIPLIWGMFVRRAPSWAGWTTVLVGLGTSYLTYRFLNATWAGEQLGFALNKRESDDWAQLAGILMNIVVGSTWFLLTPMFARTRSATEVARVENFFHEMATPVDFEKEEASAGSDNLQAKVMGLLCLVYGGFIALLVLIPNPWGKRWAFLFCGLVMFGIGWMLHRASKSNRSRVEAAARGSAPAAGSNGEPVRSLQPARLG
jgi:hypothetical protein